tara:strand:+ start:2609 stop:3445 length:837 start_codon:yes stop_codon:yes gene_type:complete
MTKKSEDKLLDAIAECEALTDSDKQEMRKGKHYVMVHTRVQIFRKHLGSEGRIQTVIMQRDKSQCMVKAIVSVWSDQKWREISNDFAEEYRGSGPVNKTSALENCCTSAIGRALSAAGLTGGEYASSFEMDNAMNNKAAFDDVDLDDIDFDDIDKPEPVDAEGGASKKSKPESEPKHEEPDPSSQPVNEKDDSENIQSKPEKVPSEEKKMSEEAALDLTDNMLAVINTFNNSQNELVALWEHNKEAIDKIKTNYPKVHEKLREGFTKRKLELKENKEK